MNRLYVVENHFTLTGAMADHRLRYPASQIPAITHALASKIAVATKDPDLSSGLDHAKSADQDPKIRRPLARRSGAGFDLETGRQPRRGRSASAGCGAANGLRDERRAEKSRHDVAPPRIAPSKRASSILQLASDIDAGRMQQLFIFGGDPVYNAPRSITLDRKTKLADRLARAAEAECPMSLGWVTMKTRLRP